jgi:hypothetical protein
MNIIVSSAWRGIVRPTSHFAQIIVPHMFVLQFLCSDCWLTLIAARFTVNPDDVRK